MFWTRTITIKRVESGVTSLKTELKWVKIFLDEIFTSKQEVVYAEATLTILKSRNRQTS